MHTLGDNYKERDGNVERLDNKIAEMLDYIPRYFKVLSKADVTGITDLSPMILWPTQKHYLENKTHRDIILKSRQTGMSTGVMAGNSYKLFTEPYQRITIVTHDQETSEFLFQTVQRFYRNLPPGKRPMTDWKSGTRMRFPKLDSYIYIDSARSDSLGVGHSLNRAHLSEISKWPPRKEEGLFADISQTIPEGGDICLESTPKGRQGLFYRLYEAAKNDEINYKYFFYPWWWDVTCCRAVKEPLKFTREENQLIEHYKLTSEQVAFRREKISELGDLFYQEYPENDIDCFITSDISVFDGVAIRRYLQQTLPGRADGNTTIWKDAIGGEKYIIGVDPAGGMEKGDWSVATVLRVKTNEYVARLRGKIPPDLFAQQLIYLARRYNMATLAVERMMHGHTILRILMENNYPNIYHHQDYDTLMGETVAQPGWKTSAKTKPIMVDTMGAVLRAGDIMIWSENFLMEASGYMWEGSKTRSASGGHDDELDALMIALSVRDQTPIMESRAYAPTSYATI